MAFDLVRKGGIPALAYTASNADLPLSCLLVLQQSEAHKQATISLRSSVHIHGFDNEQPFTLLYDADNLVTGATSLKFDDMSLAQAQLDEIARQGNPRLGKLSLALKSPCPVRCPHSAVSIAPKHGFIPRYLQLVDLARATEVHILFDYNWLHRDKRAQFQNLINYPGNFGGIQDVNTNEIFYTQADWTIFSPIEGAQAETLPSYAEASNKRPRLPSTPELPPSKRLLLSPVHFLAPSPTEKATTASTPSPKPPPSFSHALNAPDFQEAIKNAVESMLPQTLEAILPNVLVQLLAVPPSSLSLSPSVSSPSPWSETKPLHTVISAHVVAQAKAQLQKMHTETIDHVTYLRDTADVEFHEDLDEYKLDVNMIKEDNIAELKCLYDRKLEEFRENAEDIIDNVETHAEKVYADVCKRLHMFERMCLTCERDMLDNNRKRFRTRRRAVSLPD